MHSRSPSQVVTLRVTEKTINVLTKRVFKNGKWMEETTKTETLTNEKGTTKVAEKTTLRDLSFNELPNPEKQVERPPGTPDSISSSTIRIPPSTKPQPGKIVAKRDHKPLVRDNPESFARQVMVATNSYRRIHGVPPLRLNDRLNKLAKEWAEKLAKTEKMEHGDKKDVGENIYCKTSSQPWFEMSGGEVVDNWYSEVGDHKYDQEPNQGFLKTGHFTQLIWKDTKDLGVAFARNKNGHMAFVVAYFSPKGNWIGEFRDQVQPPGGAPKPKIEDKDKSKSKLKNANVKPSKSKPSSPKPTNRRKLEKIEKPRHLETEKIPDSPDNYSRRVTDTPTSTPDSAGTNDSRTIDTPARSTSRASIFTPVYNKPRNAFDSPVGNRSQSRPPTDPRYQSPVNSPTARDSPIYTPYSRAKSQHENLYSDPENQPSPIRSPPTRVTTVSPSTMSVAEDDFYIDCLNAHNYYRERHGVQSLKMNEKLNKYAQEWAEVLAKEDMMDHREDNEYGENIYMKWTSEPGYKIPGEEAVDSWYEEIGDFEFGKEPTDLSAGHFTQVIWDDTEELGVGVAKSKSGKIYVVANYDPPGNYIGQFSKKVPPPL